MSWLVSWRDSATNLANTHVIVSLGIGLSLLVPMPQFVGQSSTDDSHVTTKHEGPKPLAKLNTLVNVGSSERLQQRERT